MNAEDLYEELKEAFRYLHPEGWYGKHEIKVIAKKNKIILKYGNVKTQITLKEEGKK